MTTESDQPFSPLVGAIFTQMLTDSAATTNALLDSYSSRLLDAEAELYAIREAVSALFYGDYMPTQKAVQRAVFSPPKHLIDEYKAMQEAER